MTTEADVLVISPHPDDAEYGVAGTVARWTREGKRVVYAICTNGDKGTSDPNMKPEQMAIIREQEQLDAAKTLGVREVVFLRHPDHGLGHDPGLAGRGEQVAGEEGLDRAWHHQAGDNL